MVVEEMMVMVAVMVMVVMVVMVDAKGALEWHDLGPCV